jgi:Mg-chelatase subunit ChlD
VYIAAMQRAISAGIAAMAIVGFLCLSHSAASAQTPPHRLYVSVIDGAAKPIIGLTSTDFAVIEGGVQREITRLSPANDPMRLVLLVDNSEPMRPSIEDVRQALKAFIDGIGPQHEIGLITIGDTPVIRQEPSIDHAKVKDLAQKITTRGGTTLITAVMEMYGRFLKDAGDRWPMFIIITSDGPEVSGNVDPKRLTAMMQEMQVKDVVVHSIVMSTMGRGVEVAVSQALVNATDGHYDSISASSALTQKLTALAAAITTEFDRTDDEYVLEYSSPVTDPNAQLSVAIRRADAKVSVSRGVRIR